MSSKIHFLIELYVDVISESDVSLSLHMEKKF